MAQINPFELLRRTDRWQLARGDTLYNPSHPLHLHVPGFWDEVQFGDQSYSKLLCLSLVLEQEDGLTELFPYLSYWYWYPNRIEARYYLVVREGLGYKQQAGVRVFMDEVRRIRPDGSLSCELRFDLLKQHPPQLHAVAWGVDAQLEAIAGPAPASRAGVALNEPVVPALRFTPLLDMLQAGGLRGEAPAGGKSINALHWRVALDMESPASLHVGCRPPGFSPTAASAGGSPFQGVTVEPFLLRDYELAGHRLDIAWNRDRDGGPATGFRIWRDGQLLHESAELQQVELPG